MQNSPYSSPASRRPPLFVQTIEQAEKTLDTNLATGLSKEEAAHRLKLYGANKLANTDDFSGYKLFFKQFKNPLILVLAFGAILSLFIANYIDAAAITFIVFFNVIIGFVQEFKAQKSVEALRSMASPTCWVKRDNSWQKILTNQLVPGDLIRLAAGSLVPADARIIKSNSLLVDEAALTGESDTVLKQIEALDDTTLIIGDQTNQVFMSTSIASGSAEALVFATGMQTQVGHIAKLLTESESRPTPLQIRITHLSKILMFAAIFAVVFTMVIGLLEGVGWTKIATLGISLAVAAIPEGLATIVTIVLTLGAFQMMRANALTKHLSAVETLGSTSVICSDKTGTLTQNQMQVKKIWLASQTENQTQNQTFDLSGQGYQPVGEFSLNGQKLDPASQPGLVALLNATVLCSEAQLIEKEQVFSIAGQPTEGALVVAAQKANINKPMLLADNQILHTQAFDSTRKMMSVIVKDQHNQAWLYVKGAPDVVLQRCSHSGGEPIEQQFEQIQQTINNFGEQALRTLAVAWRKLKPEELNLPTSELETQLNLAGIFGIIDPPREDAIAAIKTCHQAGVRVIMITGDHVATARTIAYQMGIIQQKNAPAITGQELNNLNESQLLDALKTTNVFARVTPEHKLRIVQALQAQNQVVAMTGDGVNDAPALRSADIGIAMGITGTDVAKQASDLILLDDNFATIVKAVNEGRRIYDNIQKFIRQDLTTNVAEVAALLFAFILITTHSDEMGATVIALTMTPLMILWINLVSDAIPSLSIGVDIAEPNIMQRKPRPASESFFANHLGTRIITRGLIMGFVSFIVFKFALDHGFSLAYAQTLAFMTMVFGQLFHAFDARTFSTIYQRNPLENKALVLAVLFAGSASLGVAYLPWGNLVFGTTPVEIAHLLLVILVAMIPTFALSAIKLASKTKFL